MFNKSFETQSTKQVWQDNFIFPKVKNNLCNRSFKYVANTVQGKISGLYYVLYYFKHKNYA